MIAAALEIKALAVIGEPMPTAYAVTNGGVKLGLTYSAFQEGFSAIVFVIRATLLVFFETARTAEIWFRREFFGFKTIFLILTKVYNGKIDRQSLTTTLAVDAINLFDLHEDRATIDTVIVLFSRFFLLFTIAILKDVEEI